MSAVRSIVATVGADQRRRPKWVSRCPAQFEEDIAGDEVRVHAIGDVFACLITPSGTDHRRDIAAVGSQVKPSDWMIP